MVATTKLLRYAPAGALATAMAVTAADWLLTPISVSRVQATMALHAPTKPGTRRVFVLFHGLWDGPSRFEWQPDYLAGYGHVLLVGSGANDRQTPVSALRYLRKQGLLDHDIYIMGFSKGSLIAVIAARLLIQEGRPPAGIMVTCGPGSPAAVIWPHQYVRLLAHVLPAGPLANRMWQQYWSRRQRQEAARGNITEAAHAAWCKTRHIGAVLSGARLLSRGVNLQDGELAVIGRRVVVEQQGDRLIAPSRSWWTRAMGTLTAHILVPTDIHGDFTASRAHYEFAWQSILATAPAA
jgi:hypothetical protein